MVVTCRGLPPCRYGTTIVADASIDPIGKKEAAAERVFEQAENRLHARRALLYLLLG
jgi:ornithine carbamoyltransferase